VAVLPVVSFPVIAVAEWLPSVVMKTPPV
jgi:hypothetical protein